MKIKLEMEIEVTGKTNFDDAYTIVDCMAETLNNPAGEEFWREALAGSGIERKIKKVSSTMLEPEMT